MNRKYEPWKEILPTEVPRTPRMFVYFDVSGSIPEDLLNRFLFESEWRRHMSDFAWEEFVFDTKVASFEDYVNQRTYVGYGGTDSRQVWQHFVDNSEDGDGFLLLTDGYLPPMNLIPGSGPVEHVVIND